MPSDRRLHPLSFLFVLGAQVRSLLVPGLLFLVSASYVGWQVWMIPFFGIYAVVALARTLSFRYRYGEDELVVRTGFFFRNERHIPYPRIQNLDAVQNVFHRALGVAEVRLQTGGGEEPEATMKVLPLAALDEMRRRVLEARPTAAAEGAGTAPEAPTVLRLGVGDLLLHGFIESRAMLIVGAAVGLIWELGLFDRFTTWIFGDRATGWGILGRIAATWFDDQEVPARAVTVAVLGLVGALLAMRTLSMAWAALRLHGFTVTRIGDDLRTDFGLLTRVSATIPRRRIQIVTIGEGPLHRLTGRVSVRVDTAGGPGAEGESARREWLAPVIRRGDLPRFLGEVLPGLDLGAAEWRGLHPRASRRALKRGFAVATLFAVPIVALPGRWDLVLVAAIFALVYVATRRWIALFRYGASDAALFLRSGWLRRETRVARYTKIQAVATAESPFDRRAGMARVRVDTAAASSSGVLEIPYLGADVARALTDQLAAEAARTTLRW